MPPTLKIVFAPTRTRRPRRLAGCIALAALLSLALVPTLSRALAAALGPGAAVCRSAPDPMSAPALHLDACALCVLAGCDGALPPVAGLLPWPRPAAGTVPVPAMPIRQSAPDRRHAPARAPPMVA